MKSTPKIVWRVEPVPTGRYASFHKRGWPFASYNDANGKPCAQIECADDYYPRNVESGNHAPLTLYLADHSVTPWKWRKLNASYKTLKEVKERLPLLLEKFSEFVPKK